MRVVADTCQALDTLIGRTFIDAPGVSYQKRGEQLTFRDDPMVVEEAVGTLQAGKPRSHEDWTFHPNPVQFVTLRADNQRLTAPLNNPRVSESVGQELVQFLGEPPDDEHSKRKTGSHHPDVR